MWGIIIGLISGALMSIQGVFNAEVTKQSSIWLSAAFVQITAFVVCVAFWRGLLPEKRGRYIQPVSGTAKIHAFRRRDRGFYHIHGNSGDESMRTGKSRYVYCCCPVDRCLSD